MSWAYMGRKIAHDVKNTIHFIDVIDISDIEKTLKTWASAVFSRFSV